MIIDYCEKLQIRNSQGKMPRVESEEGDIPSHLLCSSGYSL
jgi:hypothetical protein